MINNELLKKGLPHLVAVVVFVLLPLIYFSPVIDGKVIKQHDIQQHKGMSREIVFHRQVYDEEPLWTNSMFGGMPAFQISVIYASNLFLKVQQVFKLGLPHPVGTFFIAFLSFYVLLLCFGVNPWLSLACSLLYGFSSINILYIAAGHNSKVQAIALLPGVLGGLVMLYRNKKLLGAAIFSLFMALELSANHVQITYYLGFLLLFVVLGEFYRYYKDKNLKEFGVRTGILALAGLLAIGPNFNNLYSTYEYGKSSTRGKTQLTKDSNGKSNAEDATDGLSKSYVTNWSFGKGETFSLFIPNVKGGKSELLGNDPALLENADPQYRRALAQQGTAYWGDQPFVSGSFYLGVTGVLLFILGLFFLKDKIKYPIMVTVLLCVLLSWGKNFSGLTNFFLDNVPLYNKFRDTKMILVVVQLVVPLVGALFVRKLLQDPDYVLKTKSKYLNLYTVGGGFLGILVLFLLFPTGFFEFFSENERSQLLAQKDPQFLAFFQELKKVRVGIFKADVLRSFFFSLLVLSAIFLFIKKKINKNILIASLGVLFLLDLIPVDKRYLSSSDEEKWVDRTDGLFPFTPSAADKQIMTYELQENPELASKIQEQIKNIDKPKGGRLINKEMETIKFDVLNQNTNYRVMNMSVSVFNDASTSYFHKSIGGYHGAKLKKFQELAEFHLYKMNLKVLNMLNLKYLINREGQVQINPGALGNAWFVQQVKTVKTADEEILALTDFDPKQEAIVRESIGAQLKANTVSSGSKIEMDEYRANYIKYSSSSTSGGLAVFSEIYYDKGWNAYIDGEKVEHYRVNYVLRALNVPAGNHTIEFKFEPRSFKIGSTVSLASSILLLLFIGGVFFKTLKEQGGESSVDA